MTATAFDTLKAAKALKDAGFNEAQAEAVVATVGDAVRECTRGLESGIATVADTMATREYVSGMADRMATNEFVTAGFAGVRAEMATKESVAAGFAEVRAEMAEMATKEYVTARFAEFRAQMAVEFRNLYRHLWLMGTGIVGVTVLLMKLLP